MMKEMTNNVMQYNFEMMLRFQKRFGDFDVSAFVGGNVMRYEYESMIQTGQTQVIPRFTGHHQLFQHRNRACLGA